MNNDDLGGTSRSKFASQKVIQTRKKVSSSGIMNNDLLSMPQKINKTTKKRRRTDPFTRKYLNKFICFS
jgi:hypothetical protein